MALLRRLLFAAVAATGAAALARPRLQQWGSTPADRARPMLLDDEIPRPTVVTNRAIGIAAPPELVWPWLAQVGDLPRGGYYSFVSIERMLGMKVENATRIMSEHQSVAAGDVLDGKGTMTVRGVTPGECLVLGPRRDAGLDFDSTWALGVYPDGDGGTRFVSRVHARYFRWTPMTVAAFLILEWGQFLMEWKMLREVKRLAEQLAWERGLELPEEEPEAVGHRG